MTVTMTVKRGRMPYKVPSRIIKEAIRLKRERWTNKSIAEHLGIGLRTVQRYTARTTLRKIVVRKRFGFHKATIHASLCSEGNKHVTKDCYHYYLIKRHGKYTYKMKRRRKPKLFVRLEYTNTCMPLVKRFIQAISVEYKYTPAYRKEKYMVVITPQPLVRDLLSYGPYNSYDWRVPSEVMMDKKLARIWTQVYFDGEATVYLDLKWRKREIHVNSVNRIGLTHVGQMLMSHFQIFCRLRGPYGKNYRLVVSGKENLLKYSREIKFYHPDKRRMLAKMLATY